MVLWWGSRVPFMRVLMGFIVRSTRKRYEIASMTKYSSSLNVFCAKGCARLQWIYKPGLRLGDKSSKGWMATLS